MQIVYVTNDVVARTTSGFTVKVAALASALSESAACTVLAIGSGRPRDRDRVVTPFGVEVRRAAVEREDLVAAIQALGPDVVVADDTNLGMRLAPSAAGRVAVHLHSIDSPIYAAARRLGVASDHDTRRARMVGLAEQAIIDSARQLWCVCEDDRAELVRRGADPRRVHVVPNVALPAADPIDPGTGTDVRMMGELGYGPNRDAAVQLAAMAESWRRRGLEWPVRIAGRTDDPALADEVAPATLMGFVPEVRDVFDGAGVVVVPLRYGGGTKVKVLDALMHGAAVVTTPEGVRGLPVRDGEHLLVRELGGPFEAAVEMLMSEPATRRRLGSAGRSLAEQRLSYPVIVEAVRTALRAWAA